MFRGRTLQLRARAIRAAYSTVRWLATGRAPRRSFLRFLPGLSAEAAWLGRPFSGGFAAAVRRNGARVAEGGRRREAYGALQRVGGLQDAVLAERGTDELEAHGEPVAEPAGDADGRQAREVHRDGADVAHVHRERVGRA